MNTLLNGEGLHLNTWVASSDFSSISGSHITFQAEIIHETGIQISRGCAPRGNDEGISNQRPKCECISGGSPHMYSRPKETSPIRFSLDKYDFRPETISKTDMSNLCMVRIHVKVNFLLRAALIVNVCKECYTTAKDVKGLWYYLWRRDRRKKSGKNMSTFAIRSMLTRNTS